MKSKLLTILFVFLLLFSSAGSAFASSNGDGSSKNDSSTAISREDVEAFINNITPEEFEKRPEQYDMVNELKELIENREQLTFDEVASIVDKYNLLRDQVTEESREDSSLQEQQVIALQEQFSEIDALAQEYYDFYKLHGKLPSEKDVEKFATFDVSVSDALKVLRDLGISYTERQLAARLAILGTIAALDGPLPVGDFIALLSGCVILGYDLVSSYNRSATALANDIGKNEGRSYIKIVSETIAISVTTAAEIKKGTKHFVANLNYGGAGGIIVGSPISLNAAQLRAKNGQDTFSTANKYAEQVVTIKDYDKEWEPPHILTRYGIKPNNLPHWHLLKNGSRLEGHHFHPWYPL